MQRVEGLDANCICRLPLRERPRFLRIYQVVRVGLRVADGVRERDVFPE